MNIDNTSYNSTSQSQAEVLRHRRRYMSPTRSKPRSPRCQYIFRGRANVFPTSPASVVPSPTKPILIPAPSTPAAVQPFLDTEPIFNMSPVHMHYLPPLKIREPINVMTLRNTGGYRHEYKPKSRGQSNHNAAVAPLLYTFPRPTSKPRPNSNTSLKDLPLKRPFGLVSQNHHLENATANLLECPSQEQHEDVQDNAHGPPPNLFLDVSLSPPPPAFPLLATQKQQQPKHIRIVQNSVARHTGDGRSSSSPKKRLRAPTPAPSPKLRNPLESDDLPTIPDSPSTIPSSFPSTPTPLRRIPSHPIPIPSHKPREEDTGVFEDVSLSSLGVDDDRDTSRVIRLGDDNASKMEGEHDGEIDTQSNHLQLTFPLLLDDPSNSTPGSPIRLYSQLDGGGYHGSRSRSSSLSPKLGLDFTLEEQRREAFIPPSPLKFPSSPRDESNQSSLRDTVKKVRNRNREMVEVEYFDNPTDDQNLPFPAQTFEPTSNYDDLSSDSEPVFPAFSPITYNAGFGGDAYSALDGLTDEPTPKKNPWLKVTTKFNNPTGSSNSTSDSDSKYTFPHSEKRYYRNGRANLNVFNPPALPSFGGSDSGSGGESNSYSEGSESSMGSDSDSGSQPFLSFPIPIFLPGDPYAVTQVDVTRVPVPSSPMRQQGEEEEDASFRSSVYGGCEDNTGSYQSQMEPEQKAAPLSSSESRRDTPTPTQTARIKSTPDTQTLNRPSTPVLRRGPEQGQRGRGRKRENGAQGDGTGAYGLLKKIIGRHA